MEITPSSATPRTTKGRTTKSAQIERPAKPEANLPLNGCRPKAAAAPANAKP
jgi:hypothetical protein